MEKTNLQLIYPEERYLESFLEACAEEKEHGASTAFFPEPDDYHNWRHTYIKRSADNRNGINLKPGYVPATELWLVEKDDFIGGISIRHNLTPSLERYGGHIGYAVRCSRRGMGYGTIMLQLALPHAAALGINPALITCDEGNIASARVMEKNGGVYQDTIDNFIDGRHIRTKRYWVKTYL